MVEIGGKPILWHIMKTYSEQGITDFIVCLGYKGYMIKEFFQNYFLHTSDVTIDLEKNTVEVHHKTTEPWKITLVETGSETMTGGRLLQIEKYLDNETFCLTYGDGLSDVSIEQLTTFHEKADSLVTVTAVQPPGRHGALQIAGSEVTQFMEKPAGDGGWINGGFFVVEPEALKYIQGETTSWELEPLEKLAKDGKLAAFKHEGFWMAMDTLKDKNVLQEIWESGKAPWKIW